MKILPTFLLSFLLFTPSVLRSAEVAGLITRTADGTPVVNVRVTLFRPDLRFFREVRTGADGRYAIEAVPEGSYQLGAAALRLASSESPISVSGAAVTRDLTLAPETHAGRWSIVGNTTPELLDGTGSGSVLPTGELMVCHNEIEPVAFEAVARRSGFHRAPAACRAATSPRC